jgi:hypothetical protein
MGVSLAVSDNNSAQDAGVCPLYAIVICAPIERANS